MPGCYIAGLPDAQHVTLQRVARSLDDWATAVPALRRLGPLRHRHPDPHRLHLRPLRLLYCVPIHAVAVAFIAPRSALTAQLPGMLCVWLLPLRIHPPSPARTMLL